MIQNRSRFNAATVPSRQRTVSRNALFNRFRLALACGQNRGERRMDSNEIGRAFSLEGKVAVVTGAASGLGREAARLFAVAGAMPVLADVDTAGLEETAAIVRAAGGEAVVWPTDVSDPAAV